MLKILEYNKIIILRACLEAPAEESSTPMPLTEQSSSIWKGGPLQASTQLQEGHAMSGEGRRGLPPHQADPPNQTW